VSDHAVPIVIQGLPVSEPFDFWLWDSDYSRLKHRELARSKRLMLQFLKEVGCGGPNWSLKRCRRTTGMQMCSSSEAWNIQKTYATLIPPPGIGVGAGATIRMHVDCLMPAAFIAWMVKRPQSEPCALFISSRYLFFSWMI